MQPLEFPSGNDGTLTSARSLLLDAIERRVFPGCAYGVWAAGAAIACEGLGRFTYAEDSAPAKSETAQSEIVQAETVYDVASLTKVVATTMMAMLLFQRGQLDLEMPLGELLPGFVVGRSGQQSSWARAVTLRHLLAHNSGLPGYQPLFRQAGNATELLRACLTMTLEAEPGSRAEYSDHGFILLGKALEVLAGSDLAAWTSREIFSPLGMHHTRFCPPASERPRIPPTEIDSTLRHRVIQGEVQDEHAYRMQGVGGHAGLFSNVPDLLRLSAALLAPDEEGLLHRQTLNLFSQRQLPEGSSRALGWDTPSTPSSSGTHFSSDSIGHLGYSGCSLWIDRQAQIAVVLLTNRTWPDRSQDAIRQLRPVFHDAVRSSLLL